jgi:hypothetical protein
MDVSTTYTSPVCKHFVLGHHRKWVPGGEAHFLALLPFVNLDHELCLKAFGKITQMFSACGMIKSLYYVLRYICSNFRVWDVTNYQLRSPVLWMDKESCKIDCLLWFWHSFNCSSGVGDLNSEHARDPSETTWYDPNMNHIVLMTQISLFRFRKLICIIQWPVILWLLMKDVW